jgi:hypothetical protein
MQLSDLTNQARNGAFGIAPEHLDNADAIVDQLCFGSPWFSFFTGQLRLNL